MSFLLPTSFTCHSLTSEEQSNGQSLTDNNIKVIQNLICDAAEKRIAMVLDPLNPVAYAQEAAEIQGQIGILKFLLECSQVVNPSIVINS
jgi:hypothetical protein